MIIERHWHAVSTTRDLRETCFINMEIPVDATGHTMDALIPNRFLFDIEFPLKYRKSPPMINGTLSGWTDAELLPQLGVMDDQPDYADLWMCWNDEGLYMACRVEGKSSPVKCDEKTYWKSDHIRLCTDMRDTRDIKRASRYCQQFYFMPSGGPISAHSRKKSTDDHKVKTAKSSALKRTKTKRASSALQSSSQPTHKPVAGIAKFQRAREHAPVFASQVLNIASKVWDTGWQLEAHIPALALNGFDPTDHPRIGLLTMIEDHEMGQQSLTIGDDLYWFVDPSTWATVVLQR